MEVFSEIIQGVKGSEGGVPPSIHFMLRNDRPIKTRKLTTEGQRLVSEASNLLESPNCQFLFEEVRSNLQLLMLSPNLLKSQSPINGEGGVGSNFQLLKLSPNLLKSQSSIMVEGVGEREFRSNFEK